MGQLSFTPSMMKVILGVYIVSAAITVITGLILIFTKYNEDNNLESYRIVINLTEELQRLNLSFGVLHVRDGKEGVPDHGPLLNKEIPFKAIDRNGSMEAIITYQKRLGFQFKCFVDRRPHEYREIEQLLKAADFSDISKGEGKKFYVWFILKDYPTYTTVDKHLNNFFYPS